MAYFLSTASQYLAMETSKPKAMLLISPLILIIVVKVCFMIKILADVRQVKGACEIGCWFNVWLKGKGGLRLAKESVTGRLKSQPVSEFTNSVC